MVSIKKIQLNFRRFEFKYIVPAKLADYIIAAIRSYVVPDSYTANEDFYYVNSIYLDSKDFHSYFEKLNGLKNRKKYRVRFYGDVNKPIDKLYLFEIKRRSDAVILKSRVKINYSNLQKLNDHKIPFHQWLSIFNNKKLLDEFYTDYLYLNMRPNLFIRYKRKPYFSRYNSNFRITFDYDLKSAKINSFSPPNIYFKKILNRLAIIEVKFNGNIPLWFANIIRDNHLEVFSFSKYCLSVDKMYNINLMETNFLL